MDQDVNSPTLRIKHAEQAIRVALKSDLAAVDLTFEHWQVLTALAERPGLTMTELAEFAVLAPASLTRHVDRLVERAWIVRRVDPDDRRRVAVALSARGNQLAELLREREISAAALGAEAGA